jgi:HD-like signal output (HDOD) protein
MVFKKLLGKVRSGPVAPQRVAKLASAVEGAILGVVGAHSIPTMPAAAQRAFQLSTDPAAEARDFVDVIESDEALSARVLKIANSVFFDRGNKATTIEDSVTVIGINELRCLLNASTLSDVFPSTHPARAQFWINDIATGLIAKQLSHRALPGRGDIAFLAGLMHDLGKLLLIQRVYPEYGKVIDSIQSSGEDFCRAEERIFPFTHTEVGQLIGERWRFTDEIISVMRGHHDPFPDAPPQVPELPQLIRCADHIAHALGFGHPRGFGRFQQRHEETLPEVWRYLHIEHGETRAILAQMKKTVELEIDLYSGKKV